MRVRVARKVWRRFSDRAGELGASGCPHPDAEASEEIRGSTLGTAVAIVGKRGYCKRVKWPVAGSRYDDIPF